MEVASSCASRRVLRGFGSSNLHDSLRVPFLEKMGNGGSSGVANECCHGLLTHSEIYSEKSEQPHGSCNALVSWCRARDRLSSSADGLIRDYNLGVYSSRLCHGVQHSAMDYLSVSY